MTGPYVWAVPVIVLHEESPPGTGLAACSGEVIVEPTAPFPEVPRVACRGCELAGQVERLKVSLRRRDEQALAALEGAFADDDEEGEGPGMVGALLLLTPALAGMLVGGVAIAQAVARSIESRWAAVAVGTLATGVLWGVLGGGVLAVAARWSSTEGGRR